MLHRTRNIIAALAALAALALGGSALAGAASKKSTTTPQGDPPAPGARTYGAPPHGAPGHGPPPGFRPDPRHPGGHVGTNGVREKPLSTADAAKVKAAALARVPGATLERVETDADHGSPFEAHLRKADGIELEVLVDRDFKVTAVDTMRR